MINKFDSDAAFLLIKSFRLVYCFLPKIVNIFMQLALRNTFELILFQHPPQHVLGYG